MEKQAEKQAALKERLKKVPLAPGVYLFKNAEGTVIYVGKARRLKNRLRSYFQPPERLLPKVRAMVAHADHFDYVVTSSELEALVLENNLIKSYQPRYNIQLRDDKSYPWLKITLHEAFPRMMIAREKKNPRDRYFGPYPNVTALRNAIRLLGGMFPLRTCRTMRPGQRPCLNYDLGLCSAPCAEKISRADYGQMVEELLATLEGGSGKLLERLREEMLSAAKRLEFEQAAKLRDAMEGLKELDERYQVNVADSGAFDLIGLVTGERESLVLVFNVRGGVMSGKGTWWLKDLMAEEPAVALSYFLRRYYDGRPAPAEVLVNLEPEEKPLLEAWLTEKEGHKTALHIPRRGEKKRLLEMLLENARILWQERFDEDLKSWETLKGLAQLFGLDVVPRRMECYDISHLAGTETVASMVVFTDGAPDRKAYRHFKMARDRNDDFLSMRETLTRRFTEARAGNPAFLPEPDLVLIDGGKGQVNAVAEIFRQLEIDVPLFSLAKKEELVFAPHVAEPWRMTRRDERLKILQRMRDEAHRFAITYNRNRRAKRMVKSALDSIPGVGAKRRQALLKAFGSVAKIREASLEEILAVPGMNRPAAEKVFLELHQP